MARMRVMVIKYGFAEVEAATEREALDQVKAMGDSCFDWSDFDEAQVVDDNIDELIPASECVTITVIPAVIRFKDETEEQNVLFSVEDTAGLQIDEDIFFSGISCEYFYPMVGKEDIGEDSVILSAGTPYQCNTTFK